MNVPLNGYVIPAEDQELYDFFGIAAFSPATVRDAIANNPEGEELVFELNSGGGDVFAGFEMYSVLRQAKCRTVARVQSIAASAASTVMLGCDTVELSPVAQVMIHLPACGSFGNRNDHLESVGVLDSITESILNAYELKCGARCSRDRLRELMQSETWLPAQDAVTLGLADRVLYAEGRELPAGVLNAAGVGMRSFVNACAMPDRALLRAEYERRTGQTACGGVGTDISVPYRDDRFAGGTGKPVPYRGAEGSWQARARLDIENLKFKEI